MTTTQWFRDRIAALELQVAQLEIDLVAAHAGVESDLEKEAELLAQARVDAVLAELAQVQQELLEAQAALDAVT